MKRVDFADLVKTPADFQNMHYHLARYDFVKRQLSPDQVVLEIGCGTGYGTFFLSDAVKKIHGVDIDADVIDYAQKTFVQPQLTYSATNILETDEFVKTREKSCDTIVCFEVIEHMEREQALDLMARINTMKKDRGVAYISTPRYRPLNERTKNRQLHHVHEYTFAELQEDLKKIFKTNVILGQNEAAISAFNPASTYTYFAINT